MPLLSVLTTDSYSYSDTAIDVWFGGIMNKFEGQGYMVTAFVDLVAVTCGITCDTRSNRVIRFESEMQVSFDE